MIYTDMHTYIYIYTYLHIHIHLDITYLINHHLLGVDVSNQQRFTLNSPKLAGVSKADALNRLLPVSSSELGAVGNQWEIPDPNMELPNGGFQTRGYPHLWMVYKCL